MLIILTGIDRWATCWFPVRFFVTVWMDILWDWLQKTFQCTRNYSTREAKKLKTSHKVYPASIFYCYTKHFLQEVVETLKWSPNFTIMYLTVLSCTVQTSLIGSNQSGLSARPDKCSYLGAQFPWWKQLSNSKGRNVISGSHRTDLDTFSPQQNVSSRWKKAQFALLFKFSFLFLYFTVFKLF